MNFGIVSITWEVQKWKLKEKGVRLVEIEGVLSGREGKKSSWEAANIRVEGAGELGGFWRLNWVLGKGKGG
jgi:hypothetical protein